MQHIHEIINDPRTYRYLDKFISADRRLFKAGIDPALVYDRVIDQFMTYKDKSFVVNKPKSFLRHQINFHIRCVIRDVVRKEEYMNTVEYGADTPGLPLHEDNPDDGTPEAIKQTLSKVMRQLTPRQRLVVRRRVIDRWGYQDIAEELKATVQAVHQSYGAAMTKLRKLLGPNPPVAGKMSPSTRPMP